MIIKSNVTEKFDSKNGYPYVGKVNQSGKTAWWYLVLFTNFESGVVIAMSDATIADPDNIRYVGEYSTTWDEDAFDKFYGSVTLTV